MEGLVSRQIDRNGNQIKYEYQGNVLTGIVDTLGEGRKITIAYSSNNKGELIKLTVTSKGIAQANGSVPERVTTVNLTGLKNVLRADQPAGMPSYDQLFPDELTREAVGFGTFNPRVISSIILPSGHSWEFKYNVYGEIAYIKTPSLGAIEYDYGPNANDPMSPGGFDRSRRQIFRRVEERRTYPQASNGEVEGRTTYGDPQKDYNNSTANVREQHFSAGGELLADTKHQYWGIPETTGTSTFGYQDWRTGKEVTTVEIDPVRGPLRETDYEFHNRDGRNWPSLQTIDKDLQPQNDPILSKTTSKLLDTGETSTVEHFYDQYNNIRRELAKGFDGQVIRETQRDFDESGLYTNAPQDNTLANRKPHIRNLITAERIKGKTGTLETETTFEYDNYGSYPLVVPAGANAANIQATQANGYDSSYTLRGNVTKMTAGANSSDPADQPSVQSQYDIFGNVVKVAGPKANQIVEMEYDPSNFFAYPTKTQQTVAGGSSNGQLLQVQRDYDYNTGALLNSTGFNGETIHYEYADPLDRVTKETRPNNFGQTSYTYSNPGVFPGQVKVESTIDSTQNLNAVSFSRYDGLLRTIEQERMETAGNVKTTSQYDGLGRTSKVTNPSRGDGATTDGATTMTYDGLSRVLKVTTTGLEGDTGTVRTEYQGSQVTVTDQAGKQRQSQTDALGRLLTVTEPSASGGLNQNTAYDYDARGNLQHVYQGTQIRTFTYDVLSRLKTATAPESGVTSYSYDVASNLARRTDGRGVVTNYAYDSLNRIIAKNYLDLTPDVQYFYDRFPSGLPSGVALPGSYSPGFGLGRLVTTASPATISQKATADFYQYDIGGRTEKSQELLDDKYYPFTMQYNAGSLPTSWTTPTQAVTNYTYNRAAEITALVRNGQALSSGIQYTASGEVKQQMLGNGLLHSMSYNSRLQPTVINLGTNAIADDNFKLTYDYGFQSLSAVTSASISGNPLDSHKNNGNLGRIRVTHGTGATTFEQNFAYDELNRLKLAKEFSASIDINTTLGITTDSSAGINVVWTTSITNADSFILERAPDGVNFQMLAEIPAQANQTRYPFLDNGSYASHYAYRVKAVSNGIASNYSNISTINTPLGPPSSSSSGDCDDCNFADCIFDLRCIQGAHPCCSTIIRRIINDSNTPNASFTDKLPAFSLSSQIAFDQTQEILYFADNRNGSLSAIDSTGNITRLTLPTDIALSANSSDSNLSQITALAIEPQSHEAYVAFSTNKLFKIASATNAWTVVAGEGTQTAQIGLNLKAVKLGNITALTFDATNLWLATTNEPGQAQLLQIDPEGKILRLGGQLTAANQNQSKTEQLSLTNTTFNSINNLTIDPDTNNLYITDSTAKQIYQLSLTTGELSNLLGGGTAAFHNGAQAQDIKLDDIPTSVLVKKHALLVTLTSIKHPSGIYVIDKGIITGLIGGQDHNPKVEDRLYQPQSLSQDAQGNLLLVDRFTNQVILISTNTRSVLLRLGQSSTSTPAPPTAQANDIHPLADESVNWQQAYEYDRYGNRTNLTDLDGDHPLTVNQTNNRLTTSGVTYDLAGNVITDAQGNTYAYDAENRMTSAMVGGITTNYYYNGQGKRVKKDVMGVVTRFVYDGSGRLALEYEADPVVNISQATKEYVYGAAGMQVVIEPQETDPSKQIQYLTADHLGSPRVITDGAGNVISRRDFYPFGEDIDSSIGARGNIPGFSNIDNIRQRFTGYQKDAETGLDFAQARYFGSMQGRFLSVDPLGGIPTNPQSWNKYTYCQNNPTNLTDPMGLTSFKPIITINPGSMSYDSNTLFSQDPQKGNPFSEAIDNFNKYVSSLEKNVMDYFNKKPTPAPTNEGLNPVGNTLDISNKAAENINTGLSALMVLDLSGLGGATQTIIEYQMGKTGKKQVIFSIALIGLGTEERIVGVVNPNIYRQLEKQLAKDGAETIFIALKSANKTLEKHIAKLPGLQYQSQVRGTIENVTNQITTLEQFIVDKGLVRPK